jgi:hypothetical protein
MKIRKKMSSVKNIESFYRNSRKRERIIYTEKYSFTHIISIKDIAGIENDYI